VVFSILVQGLTLGHLVKKVTKNLDPVYLD